MAQVSEYAVVGKKMPRPDAVEKVTGKAVYGMDVRRPGMLHAKILWSRHAHARILGIDITKAEALPGVKAVITAKDLPNNKIAGLGGPTDRSVLAENKVHFLGDPVAAVAAETEEIAEEALKLIQVDYEPLPIVLDPEEAMKPDAPWVADVPPKSAQSGYKGEARNVCGYTRIHSGDVEKGFAEADVVYEDDYETAMVHQGYLEPHVAVAEVDPAGKLTVWASTQVPFAVRSGLVNVLGLPMSKVQVIATHTGGGFGGKAGSVFEAVAAALAVKAGRPVRLALTREEELTATFPRHPLRFHLKMGAKKDGTITAFQARAIADTGGYAGEFGPTMASITALLLTACYRMQNVDVRTFAVQTNKPDCGAYRAPGATQAAFALESHLDAIAAQLGMDPVEFRLKNAWEDGDKSATGQVIENIGLKDTIRAAAEHIGWGEEELGPNQGLGLAAGVWFSGGFLGSGAYVKVNEDGSIGLITGAADSGTGATLGGLRLIVAEELGVSPDDVVVQWADTDAGPWDGGAVGSRTTYAAGNAARAAAIDARNQLFDLAAEQLEASPDDLEARDKMIRVKGSPERAVPLAALAMSSHFAGGQILGRGSYVASQPQFDPSTIEGLSSFATILDPILAVHTAKVEVNRETGQVKILRYVAAQDVGFVINPLGVEGQIEGGTSEGIGEAISEEMVFDTEGRLLNPTLLDYKMPTALDHPMIESVIVEGHPGGGPYGAKGVGEPPITAPPAAIANAIYWATGVRVKKLPLSPENVWAALKEAGKLES